MNSCELGIGKEDQFTIMLLDVAKLDEFVSGERPMINSLDDSYAEFVDALSR